MYINVTRLSPAPTRHTAQVLKSEAHILKIIVSIHMT
jgi:hypothetical protein